MNITCAELEKLRAFYETVKILTLNHDTLGGFASVSPKKLGDALSEVDPEWWKP